ncbi:MAG: porin family protein [Dysgonomonas sp.]
MKKVVLLAAACLLIFNMNVNAQSDSPISFGVKGGLNLSNFGGDDLQDGIKDDKNAILGYNAGVTLDYQLAGSLYLMTGLEFTTKGAKYDVTYGGLTGSLKFNPMYIQLPVHAGFKLPLTEDFNLVLHGGIFAAYGVGGKMKVDVSGSNSNVNLVDMDLFKDNGFNKVDFGVGLGAGVELGKLSLGIGYDLGLANMKGDFSLDNTTIHDKDKLRTQSAYATIGVKF